MLYCPCTLPGVAGVDWQSAMAVCAAMEVSAVLALQALQNIRTVVAYAGEAQTCKQYNAALAKPQKVHSRSSA